MLDADVLIDLLKEIPEATAWLATQPELPPVSGFAAMELVVACRDKRELQSVEKFLSVYTLLWPSETDMRHALTTLLRLQLVNSIGLLDCVIAATALGQGLPVITLNVKHFRIVPGLVVEKPYTK